MMAVSLSSTNSPSSTAVPSPPLPPPRSSSLSPGAGTSSSGAGRSRSSRRGTQGHREVRFGNYILGQTLGEGEFGKVKLGWRRPEPGQTTGDGVQVLLLNHTQSHTIPFSAVLMVGRYQTHPKGECRFKTTHEQNRPRNRNPTTSPP